MFDKTKLEWGERYDRDFTRDIEKMIRDARFNILPITTAGEPVLREETQSYTGQLKPSALAKLINTMRITMIDAPGVGLAAPQVGLGIALAVLEDHVENNLPVNDDGTPSEDPREFGEVPFHVIINPHYEPIGTTQVSFYEGCLSVPGYSAVRKRWLDVRAHWQDEKGVWREEDLHGWPARIFQHETDHLSGELYIDKAELRSLTTDEHLRDYWWQPSAENAAKELGFSL